MSTLKATNLQHASATSPNITLGSDGSVAVGGSNISPQTGFKNRIINGDMRIDQRYNGASVNTTNGDNYNPDRWLVYDTAGGKMSIQRVTDAPVGFINSQKITSLTATTPGADDYYFTCQRIEGLNVADLAWGTANAQSITVSFKVKSSLTGSFSGAIGNATFNRSYPFSYTISSANTWQEKTVTIPGDTSGTWATNTSSGLQLVFDLGSGSSRTGAANTWSGNDYRKVTGSVSLINTNGATFYITGVQLEKGSVATPFEFRSIGQELALCQRYFEFAATRIDYQLSGSGVIAIPFFFKTTKRTTPSITFGVIYTGGPSAGTTGTDYFTINPSGTPSHVAFGDLRINAEL